MHGFDLYAVASVVVKGNRPVFRIQQAAGSRDDARQQRAQFELARDLLENPAEGIVRLVQIRMGLGAHGYSALIEKSADIHAFPHERTRRLTSPGIRARVFAGDAVTFKFVAQAAKKEG